MCPRVLVPVTRESQGTISDCERETAELCGVWSWCGTQQATDKTMGVSGTRDHCPQCTLCRGHSPGHIMPANISRGYNWSNQIIGEHSRNALSLCSAAIMAIIKSFYEKGFFELTWFYVNIPSECIQCTPLQLHYWVHFLWKSPIYSSIVLVM